VAKVSKANVDAPADGRFNGKAGLPRATSLDPGCGRATAAAGLLARGSAGRVLAFPVSQWRPLRL